MLRGIATVSFWADDVAEARRWYADLLGFDAYFERFGPDGRLAYTEFRIGDYQQELGLIDRRYASSETGPKGAILYWHVDDVDGVVEKLLSMGATEHEPLTHRGENFVTASVVDPFGNILGVMNNPHYVAMLGHPAA